MSPEVPIDIPSPPCFTRAILVAGWIAQRVEKQLKALENIRAVLSALQYVKNARHHLFFISVNESENTYAQLVYLIGAADHKSRDAVASPASSPPPDALLERAESGKRVPQSIGEDLNFAADFSHRVLFSSFSCLVNLVMPLKKRQHPVLTVTPPSWATPPPRPNGAWGAQVSQ
jgi:hypothetical protein